MEIRFKSFAFRDEGVEAYLSMDRPSARATRAFRRLHEMAANDMLPYMPSRSGGFRERTRAANASMTGSGRIYAGVGPMGRYLYQNRAMVDAVTGKGPQFIPGVGPRFEKGTRLRATDRALHYTSAAARPAWFDYAKAQRLRAWIDQVQKIMDGEG